MVIVTDAGTLVAAMLLAKAVEPMPNIGEIETVVRPVGYKSPPTSKKAGTRCHAVLALDG